jgi:hypothetical protein
MTTTELEIQKAGLAREILNETDENIVKKLIISFRNVKETTPISPCRFSVEEIRNIATNAIRDAKQGLGKSIEEVRAIHPRI